MAGTAPTFVASGQTGNPIQRSAASAAMLVRSKLLRDIYGGTETMRAAGAAYLPQYDRETATRYAARLASTFALNKTQEAVDAASAKPFRTLVTLSGNTDPDLDLWYKDIDLQGNHLHVFAHQFFNDGMLIGQSHILVDHPTTSNMPNLAAQKASGARPYMKHIKDEQLVAAYAENIGGTTKVFHARILGRRYERTADFKEIIWDQLYVIEVEPGATQGIVQLWEARGTAGGGGTGGGYTFIAESPLTMPEVPLVTLYAGEKEGDFLSKSIFRDLAYKQIEHWISSSDQRSIMAAARFPMLACSGIQIDPDEESTMSIGPYKVLYSPDPNGRWYYVEPKGTAIDSGLKDLQMLEMQMDMMALNPVTGTHRQYVPQNERDIQETRVHSVVHDIALSARKSLEKAVGFMGLWTNKDFSQVKVELNYDFASTKDRMVQFTALMNTWEKRGITRQTFLQQAVALDVLPDDFDIPTELAALEALDVAAGVTAGQTGTPPAGPTPAKPAPPVTPPPPASQNRPLKQF